MRSKLNVLIERCIDNIPDGIKTPRILVVKDCNYEHKFIEMSWIHPSNQVKVFVDVYPDRVITKATFGPETHNSDGSCFPDDLAKKTLTFFKEEAK